MALRDWAREAAYTFVYALTGPGQGIRAILMYHSVGAMPSYGVPLPAFRDQMRFLAAHFQVVRLCDLPAAPEGGPPDANVAVVTLDDGCLDAHELALPVLEELGNKATFSSSQGCWAKPCGRESVRSA